MPSWSRLGVTLALGLVVILATACRPRDPNEEFGTLRLEPGEPLRIGVSVALSGDDTGDAGRIERGVRLAVELDGDVKGHPLAVEVRDDGCSAERSVAVARAFATEPGIAGVIGPMCSRGCVPASLIYDDAKLAMLTPSCTASVLTSQGLDTVFRVAWNGELAGEGGAKFAAKELRAKRVFAINDGTFYGKTLRDAFKVNLEARGGRLIADEVVSADEWDFTALVAEVKAARPDLVLFAGFLPAGTFLIQQLRYHGVAAPFIGGDALRDVERFVIASNGAAQGAYVGDARPLQGKTYDEFARRYRERWGEEPGPFSAQGYDAARVLLRAVDKVARRQRGALLIDRKALRDAILATDHRGASGRIRFWPNGDRRVGAAAVITQVQGSGFTVVKEFEAKQ